MRTTHASTKCRTGNDRYPFCFFLSQLLLGFRKMLPLPPIVKNIHRNLYDSLIYFFFLSFGLLFLFLLRLLLIPFLFYALYFVYFFQFFCLCFCFQSFRCLLLTSFIPKSFPGPASARSYKIGVVGNNWLVGWLVTQFSQKRL